MTIAWIRLADPARQSCPKRPHFENPLLPNPQEFEVPILTIITFICLSIDIIKSES